MTDVICGGSGLSDPLHGNQTSLWTFNTVLEATVKAAYQCIDWSTCQIATQPFKNVFDLFNDYPRHVSMCGEVWLVSMLTGPSVRTWGSMWASQVSVPEDSGVRSG